MMTKSQRKALHRVRELTEEMLLDENHEIKIWRVNDMEYFVSVLVEVGLKNDEGTMASVFARDRAHLFVGKKGAITYPVVTSRGNVVRRRLTGSSLLQAVIEQRG